MRADRVRSSRFRGRARRCARCGPGTRTRRCPRESTVTRRTSKEPLGPPVVRVPLADSEPSCTSRQRQVWPMRLLSTSPSTSSRPSSGPTLIFQSVEPEQEPRRTVSSPPARAAGVGAGHQGGGERRACAAAVSVLRGVRGHGGLLGSRRHQRGGAARADRHCPVVLRPRSRTTGSPSRSVPGDGRRRRRRRRRRRPRRGGGRSRACAAAPDRAAPPPAGRRS